MFCSSFCEDLANIHLLQGMSLEYIWADWFFKFFAAYKDKDLKHDFFKAEVNILRLLLFALKFRAQVLPSFLISRGKTNLQMKTSFDSFLLRQLCIFSDFEKIERIWLSNTVWPRNKAWLHFFWRHKSKCQAVLPSLLSTWLSLDVSFWVYYDTPNSQCFSSPPKVQPCGEGTGQ